MQYWLVLKKLNQANSSSSVKQIMVINQWSKLIENILMQNLFHSMINIICAQYFIIIKKKEIHDLWILVKFHVDGFCQGNQDISSLGMAAVWVISATPPNARVLAAVGIWRVVTSPSDWSINFTHFVVFP